MALIMNACSINQSVQVHGAWFTFGPGQIKDMQEDKVFFLTSRKGYLGFVTLPDEMADLDFRNSKDGQEILAKAKVEGVGKRIAHLESVRDNELVSLKRDLEQKNIKSDPRSFMSDGAIAAMEELAQYKKKNASETEKRIERVKQLEELLKE